MYKGTIVENSLKDKSMLKNLKVIKSWKDGSWTLHDVLIETNQVSDLSKCLNEGPWYIHIWQENNDEIKVIFKDKVFTIIHSDKSTWIETIDYGKSIGIPEQQLDFPTN